MKQKNNRRTITVLLVLILILAALVAGMIWFITSHIFINGKPYARDAEELDLRGKNISLAEYHAICDAFPGCEIRWDVPFQNTAYADDTTAITVKTLSDADLDMLEYLPHLTTINAEGCQDYSHLEALRQRYPDIHVSYFVTIDGREYPQDAKSLTVTGLTGEDIDMVSHLWELESVDASACRDYVHLSSLREIHPELKISYQVEVLGQTLTEKDAAASFDKPDLAALKEQLSYAVDLKSVHMEEPAGNPQDLKALLEAYPEIDFVWNKTLDGVTYSSELEAIDLSEVEDLIDRKEHGWSKPASAEETTRVIEEVKDLMAWFPKTEKVIFPACHLDNKTMAAFREEMRPEYKAVWTVYVTKKQVRTDQEVIHSSAMGVSLIDEQSYDLEYCEDAIVVDVGHSYIKYFEWVKGMPNLKYLILADNWIKDLTPISQCKNLVYLELFDNKHIPDYTPLLGCTSLQDLNLSETYADIEPLKEMTWLNNLWMNMCELKQSEVNALTEALPNTTVTTRGGTHNALGFRQLQNYFDMRDIMGLNYNKW